MPPLELEALAEDIQKHGQREPGVLYEGMVLDGWHRYLACNKAGVKFTAVKFDGDDPGAFVISKNRHRRHQSAAELALSVVECRNWKPHGYQRSATVADHSSAAEMAEESGVSERTIERAKAAVRAGKADDVRSGKTTLTQAAGEKREKPKKEKKPKVVVADRKFEKLYEAVKEELAETKEKLAAVIETAEERQDKLTMFEATEPDEQQQLIADLQKKIVRKDAEIARLTSDRNRLNDKCNQLMRQVRMLEKKARK